MKRLVFIFVAMMLVMSCAKVNDGCVNRKLYECINKYIGERGMYQEDENGKLVLVESYYYSVHFFEKDAKNYFTIWYDMNPSYEYLDSNLYDYSYAIIGDHDVVSIKNKDKNPPLFFDCIDISVLEEKRLKGERHYKKGAIVNYDGPADPATYEYYCQNGKYRIERLDKGMCSDIFSDYPFEYFEH